MVAYRPGHLRFARAHRGAAYKRARQNRGAPTALIVERESDYAIDYELAFEKFGYRSLFTAIPGEAGRALVEYSAICVVVIDADTVDVQRCMSTIEQLRRVKMLVVVASP